MGYAISAGVKALTINSRWDLPPEYHSPPSPSRLPLGAAQQPHLFDIGIDRWKQEPGGIPLNVAIRATLNRDTGIYDDDAIGRTGVQNALRLTARDIARVDDRVHSSLTQALRIRAWVSSTSSFTP